MARPVRLILLTGLAVLISALATSVLSWAWFAIDGGPMSLHGWIALAIGVFGTLVLAWFLMSLAFRSNRDGWDDRVDNRLDPGSRPDDD